MPDAIDKLLATDGPVARAFGAGFEARPEQLAMARAVDRAMGDRGRLLVEAGTGVGKSFAYLLPAIRRIVEDKSTVVVATNTIALQEQVVGKDLPLLEKVFGGDTEGGPLFKAELVKGRGNYVSVRRLARASEKQDALFPDAAARRSLHVIEDWAYDTTDGSLSTLPPVERPGVWDRVQSDSGNCMGRKCPTYDRCFYQQARRRMEKADLLITNHALFFSDLALRARGVGFLPKYDHVVLDEAHMVEDVASEHFGVSLSEGRVAHLLSSLYNARRRKGYLATLAVGERTETLDRVIRRVMDAGRESERFFEDAGRLVRSRIGTARAPEAGIVDNGLTPIMSEIALGLRRLKDVASFEEDRFELNAYAERASAIADDAEAWADQTLEGCVYWVETKGPGAGVAPTGPRRGLRTTVAASPVEVAPLLREHLFSSEASVTLTSATLTTAGRLARAGATAAVVEGEFDPDAPPPSADPPGFAHIRSRLGCDEGPALLLGSPFDHATQVELRVDRTMPDPRSNEYLHELAWRIGREIEETDGGAFVLFTAFGTLHATAERLRPELEAAGRPVWVQGKDGPRSTILDGFRSDERSVLFGTASFWQGVDVRGRQLRNVIITRLPFDPPDRPLTEARLDLIRARGGDPFFEDSLPRAVIRFKQGFGRLVRSASDSGRVVVLDPRVVTKGYGRSFLRALPEGVEMREIVWGPAGG